MTSTTATQTAALIRKSLKKELGVTGKQVSVRSKYFSMGSSVDLYIRVAGIDPKAVEAIAKGHSRVRYCEATGDILGGGNMYVHVHTDRDAYVGREPAILAAIGGIAPHSYVNYGPYQIQNNDKGGELNVFRNDGDATHFHAWNMGECVSRIARETVALSDADFAAIVVETKEDVKARLAAAGSTISGVFSTVLVNSDGEVVDRLCPVNVPTIEDAVEALEAEVAREETVLAKAARRLRSANEDLKLAAGAQTFSFDADERRLLLIALGFGELIALGCVIEDGESVAFVEGSVDKIAALRSKLSQAELTFDSALDGYVAGVHALLLAGVSDEQAEIEVKPGRRYIKIIKVWLGSRSVHSFIDRTNGDILKAATWKAPAKHARGNILTDENFGLTNVSWTGARYL